jgi:hypothetical protein
MNSPTGVLTSATVKEVNLGAPGTTLGPGCSGLLMTDASGTDAVVCGTSVAGANNPGRYTFGGSWGGNSWSGNVPGSTTIASSTFLFGTESGSPFTQGLFSLSTGALTQAFSNVVWAIDASASPVLYSSSGAALAANYVSGSGVGSAAPWALPTVPGTAISDVAMDKKGNLYVSSGGQVSAIATDSPGLGTGGFAWPLNQHDACRSSNLEYVCPW